MDRGRLRTDAWPCFYLAEIAMIQAEIERLEKVRKDCTDSGLGKWIEAEIEKQKEKLASGNNPATAATKT
jgi:hypothetical protein